MMPKPTPTRVMVTGATGYIAGWLVRRLLEDGHTVHAAVRDPQRKDKLAHLDQLANTLPGQIAYFKADLMSPGSYTEAMADCELVFHTASPFILSVEDPQRDLVAPAVEGTRSVLNSVNSTPSVRRVVITSSCAAIYGDNIDITKTTDNRFTEQHWNTTSTLTHGSYPFSKVEAEKAAWEMAQAQSHWQLATINPSFVLGPGTTPVSTSESLTVMKQMADGTMKTGAPDLYFGMVDVRDVAEAHYRAGFMTNAQGRYITSGTDASLVDIATILRQHFDTRWPFPKRTLPKWLLWLVGAMVNPYFTRRMVSRNVGIPIHIDNHKSREELGMTYRALETTITEMFQQLVDNGIVKQP